MARIIKLFNRKPIVIKRNRFITTAMAQSAWQCGGEDC